MSEIVSKTVKPPVSEVVKPIEVSLFRKIMVNLKESKPKFLKNTRLVGKIIEKTSLTIFY